MSANCEECVYYDYDEELAAYVSTGPATITARPDGSEHDEP